MLDLRFTNQFKKDYKLARKRGFDLSELEMARMGTHSDLFKK